MKHFSASRRLLTLALLTLVLAAPLPSGRRAALATGNAPAAAGSGAFGDVTTPLHATLSIDRLPPIGKPAEITCRVNADQPAPGTTVRIELPANARLDGGDLAWQGDLVAGQSIEVSATVVFAAMGDTTLLCRTLRPIDAKNSWGDLAALYLSVGETATQAGFATVSPAERLRVGGLRQAGDGTPAAEGQAQQPTPRPDDVLVEAPPALTPHAPPTPSAPALAPATPANAKDLSLAAQARTEVTAPMPETSSPQTPSQQLEAPTGDLTVTGNWAYFDRDNNYVGALEMLIELVRGDNYGHLAWCFTDLGGNYSCGPVSNPGGVGVRTLLHSWTNYNPNGDILAVVNPDWGTSNALGNTFRTQTGVSVFPDGTHNIGSWYVFDNDNYERAYWIQREVNDTWRFTYFLGLGGTATSGPSTAQWKIDSTDGTYYVPGGNVHLAGVDPLGKSVAMHEYSHNVMYNIYGNYYPPNPNCNPHSIPGSSSQGCAWTEGFAEFIPSVVSNDPTFYWPSGASLDLEGPTWGTAGWNNGDTIEGRVAGALWDMYDAADDGDDIYSDGGFANFWDVLFNATDNVLSDFWFDWSARGHSNVSWGPIMDLYQNTIDYRSGPANDDFANAQVFSSVPFYVTGLNTTGATTQGLDPHTACASISYPRQARSVWYVYTPTITGSYNLNTVGSNYDTVLSVWEGPWGALVSQGCDDDTGGSWTSSLSVPLVGGTTYHIEAMAYGSGDGGSLNLAVTLLPPGNDDFDDAYSASGASYADYENTTNATTAGDDPSFACGIYFNGQGSHSVWYTIASAYNRVLTASTLTSNYDTVLGIFTGPRGALSLAACNDDTGGTLQSQTQVALQAGTLYHIEAVGYGTGNGALNFATSLGPICPDFVAPAGVGVEDVTLVANLWSQAAGPPYDYDGNALITIYDIMQVTPQWGQNCLATASPPETPVAPGLK